MAVAVADRLDLAAGLGHAGIGFPHAFQELGKLARPGRVLERDRVELVLRGQRDVDLVLRLPHSQRRGGLTLTRDPYVDGHLCPAHALEHVP